MPDSDKEQTPHKRGGEPERRSGLAGRQSTVARLVGQAEERQREKTTGGRGRAGHGGKLGQDKAGRDKATYDLPLDYQDLVRQLAEQEDVSQSDIVRVAIKILHDARQAGQINLADFKIPARSLKASWKLQLPEDFEFFSE